MNKLKLYFRFSRLPSLMFVAIFLVSAYYGGSATIYELLIGSALIFLIYHFATTYNDMCDTRIDKISNTSRPLISEPQSKNAAARIVLFDIALTLIIIMLNFSLVVAVPALLMLLLLYAYSAPRFRLKKTFTANLIIGLMALTSGWLGMVFGGANVQSIGAALFSFFIVAVFTSIKDFKDMKGDKVYGIKSLPVMLGARNAARLLQFVAIMALPVGLMLKFFVVNSAQWWAYASLALTGIVYVIVLELLRIGRIGGRTAHKISMAFAPVAVFLFAY